MDDARDEEGEEDVGVACGQGAFSESANAVGEVVCEGGELGAEMLVPEYTTGPNLRLAELEETSLSTFGNWEGVSTNPQNCLRL